MGNVSWQYDRGQILRAAAQSSRILARKGLVSSPVHCAARRKVVIFSGLILGGFCDVSG
jgi:hypothetical protein